MVQTSVLDKIQSDKLSVYIVWTPVLREDDRDAAGKAVELVTDKRVKQFWDGDKSLGNAYGSVVKLPRDRTLAWDVYFVLDQSAEWTASAPPEPASWMHQLGNDERLLDGEKLRQTVMALLRDTTN